MSDIYDDMEEEFEVITMTDEETGEVTEFAIIDNINDNNNRYLLVIESQFIDDDEADAIILMETSIQGDDVTYTLIDSGEEFDRIAELFSKASDEYYIELEG